MTAPIVVWLRRDLRLADQPAFHAAASGAAPVIPVYVLDDDAAGDYIREWVPELAGVSDRDIHDPPERPQGYRAPLIGHRAARERALAAYRTVRR